MADDHGTKHIGVRRAWPGRWETFDRETGAQIGPPHPTRYEAADYARERQQTTYAGTLPEETLDERLDRVSRVSEGRIAASLRWGEDVDTSECRCGAIDPEVHATDCTRGPEIPETELRALHGDR